MDLGTDTGESLLQLEIRKCQQAFAMSNHDEPEEFEDIQFFHRIPPVALQSFKMSGNKSSGDILHGDYTRASYDEESEGPDSENSYMFPDNVMEYGEPQFFPGNCVGYLETILEETDEDCDEEEGSSGRHWWTPDSDTDTDSVIQNDPTANQLPSSSSATEKCLLIDFLRNPVQNGGIPVPLGRSLSESSASQFPATASSKPFELEDLYLFDQLDLAFEETLMKPRRRAGFAFEAELHLPMLEEPLEKMDESDFPTVRREEPELSELVPSGSQQEDEGDEDETLRAESSSADDSNTISENEEPAVVNEEDFFCSSSASSSDGENSGENSGLSETDTSEGSTSTSGSSEEDKEGVVLAEFSLNNFNHSGSEMYKNNHANPHRRSYEAPSKIRSFRSFDSLNSLLGTELLFSSPDTFPPTNPPTQFQYIKEVNENESEERPSRSSGSRSSRSSSTEEKMEVSRKSSGEASSENLSEDSGIHDLVQLHSVHESERQDSPQEANQGSDLPHPTEFALNPFIYSSASEESSMLSSVSPYSYESESHSKVNEVKPIESSDEFLLTVEAIKALQFESPSEGDECDSIRSLNRKEVTTGGEERLIIKCVNNGEGVLGQSGPMSTLTCYSEVGSNVVSRIEEPDHHSNPDFHELSKLNPRRTEQAELGSGSGGGFLEGSSSIGGLGVEAQSTIWNGKEETPKEDAFSTNSNPSSTLSLGETILSLCQGRTPNFGIQNGSEDDYVTLCVRPETRKGPELEPSVLAFTSDGADVRGGGVQESLEQQEPSVMEVEQGSPQAGVPIKSYGGALNNDVQVYLVSSGSRTPSPTVPAPPVPIPQSDGEGTSATGSLKTKTVHFCPVVSEISWRESYTEPSPEESPEHQVGNGHAHAQNGDDSSHQEQVIEKVHIHSQILSQPLPMVIPRSEKERLLELEPSDEPVRMPVSVVPDLVSHCEKNSSQDGEIDEVDASAHVEPYESQSPYYYQQQIFPAMFVASAKEAAEANHVNLKKNGKRATYVAPPLAPTTPPTVTKTTNKTNPKNLNDVAEKKEVKSKPGFFQRLSKIRLSGSKPKQPKAKIYPKEIEALNSKPKGGVPSGPILKNGPSSPLLLKSSSPTNQQPPPPPTTNPNGLPKEHDECSEAFENILEEIAGLNTILQRQQFPVHSSSAASTGKRSFAERKEFLINQEEGRKVSMLDTKLTQFKEEASKTRDEISRSHPDLETIEDITRKAGSSPGPTRDDSRPKPSDGSPGRSTTLENRKTEREWYRLLRSAAEKYYHGGQSGSRSEEGGHTGIVETDLDTGTSRELLDGELVVLEELKIAPPPLPSTLPPTNGAKAQSLTNLTSGLKLSVAPEESLTGIDDEGEERAKSLEFLLDEKKKSAVSPPENKLREDNRQLSEHELRIQRSLQKINVPEWYRRHSYRSKSMERDRGAELRKDTPLLTTNGTNSLKLLKRNDYGSAGGLAGGWAGLSAYRTPSLSHLPNGGLQTGSLNRSNFVRGRPATMSATRSSKESLMSPSSTASQSPSAFERSSFTYGMPLAMTRFGKGRQSSTSGTSPGSASPSTSGQSSLTFVKKPYLGWRSQERLDALAKAGGPLETTPSGGLRLSTYRPPAERLAADMITRQKKAPNRPMGHERPPLPKPPLRAHLSLPPVTAQIYQDELPGKTSPTIHDSIKEVTNAINQFVTNGNEPPKPHPRQKNVKKQAIWFESSFVGKKADSK